MSACLLNSNTVLCKMLMNEMQLRMKNKFQSKISQSRKENNKCNPHLASSSSFEISVTDKCMSEIHMDMWHLEDRALLESPACLSLLVLETINTLSQNNCIKSGLKSGDLVTMTFSGVWVILITTVSTVLPGKYETVSFLCCCCCCWYLRSRQTLLFLVLAYWRLWENEGGKEKSTRLYQCKKEMKNLWKMNIEVC